MRGGARSRSWQPTREHPLDGGSLPVGPLQVGGDERRVAQRHSDARVAQEPAYVVEADAIPQPRRRGEVPKRMGMQPAVRRQSRPDTQAV